MKDIDCDLAALDPEVHRAIAAELDRQQTTLEMIASENFAPVAVNAGPRLGADLAGKFPLYPNLTVPGLDAAQMTS